jgi:hypothetical protein
MSPITNRPPACDLPDHDDAATADDELGMIGSNKLSERDPAARLNGPTPPAIPALPLTPGRPFGPARTTNEPAGNRNDTLPTPPAVALG